MNINAQKFYEGKFTTPNDFRFTKGGWIGALYRTVAMDYSRRRARFIKQNLSGTDNKILDFGCGAGTRLLIDFGSVTGVDYSNSSLKIAAEIYDQTRHIDGKTLPFDQDTFDAIVAIDAFGHIPVDEKDALLQEFMRVLKPGGKVILSAVETDGKNWFSRVIKKDEQLYHEVFVLDHGHLGYEYPLDVKRRFEKAGFGDVAMRRIEGGLFSDPLFYAYWFRGSPYLRISLRLRVLTFLARGCLVADRILFRRKAVVLGIFRFALGLLDMLLNQWWTSINHSRGVGLCAVKPGSSD